LWELISEFDGKQLMNIHLNYEQAKEYPLEWVENESIPFSWRIEKVELTPNKTAMVENEILTLAGIPQESFLYRQGNHSALEWVIDQYQVTKDERSGIESDPNNLDDEKYIVRLVKQVVTASVETVKLVNELALAVTANDWNAPCLQRVRLWEIRTGSLSERPDASVVETEARATVN
jgi:predicted helicase